MSKRLDERIGAGREVAAADLISGGAKSVPLAAFAATQELDERAAKS